MEDKPPLEGAQFDHLFAFRNESDARAALGAFQVDGFWKESHTLRDVRIVLARPIVDGASLIVPQRELGGYRVMVAQSEPRIDLWDAMPELEAIGDTERALRGPDFYVRVRPGSEGLFPLMEPVWSGSAYNQHRRHFMALSLVDGRVRHIDGMSLAEEVSRLRGAIENLRRSLQAVPKRNDPEAAGFDDDLGLMLAMLQSRFVNANALERLMNTTVKAILRRGFSAAVDAAAGAALLATMNLLSKGWGAH